MAKNESDICEHFLGLLTLDIGAQHPSLKITERLIDRLSSTEGCWDVDQNKKTHFLDRWFDYPDAGRKLRVIRLASDGMIHFDVDLQTYGMEPLLSKHLKYRELLMERLDSIPGIEMPNDVESHRVFDVSVFGTDDAQAKLLESYLDFQQNVCDDDLIEL